MGDNKYSKSLKCQLNKEAISAHKTYYDKNIAKSGSALAHYYREHSMPLGESILLQPRLGDVRFPPNFRQAVGNDYRSFLDLYKKIFDYYNNNLVGMNFPRDMPEIGSIEEFSEYRGDAIALFSEVGKKLSFKKRRMSVFDAHLFLYKNVLSPLDNISWMENTKIDIFFDHAIDVLAQSFLSQWLQPCAHYDNNAINDGVLFNLATLNLSTERLNFIFKQVELYNLGDYISSSSNVEFLDSQLPSDFVIPNEDAIDDMLFDVFEIGRAHV